MTTEFTAEDEARELARVAQLMDVNGTIFVFGSNRAGIHGGGAALVAFKKYGAKWAHGEGLRGLTYAIPTKDHSINTLPLAAVAVHVERFLDFARRNSTMQFAVTRIGCGLAGYTDHHIAPLFADAPENCELPTGWRAFVASDSSSVRNS